MDPAELIVVALWSFVVAIAGGVAGLVMGNLRLPVVIQFASSTSAGAGANVAISAASTLTSSVTHLRAGRVNARLFWLMAPPSFVGGTLRLPAMVRWLGTTPRDAVGTNAAAGAVVGIGGLVGHLAGGVDWGILGAGVAGAVPGASMGARLTGRLGDRQLLRAVSAVLVVAGVSLAVEVALG